MQKLLYTEEGLQLIKSRGSDSPSKSNSLVQNHSTHPHQMQIQSLSRQCNRVRVKTLKTAFNLAVPEHLLNALPFTRSKKAQSTIPKVISMDNINNNVDQWLAMSTLQNTPSDRHSISRHHEQSIRLRTGNWYQWKNIPLNVDVMDDFQKQIKFHQNSTEEERMRREKRQNQHFFEMEKVDQVQKRTKENLNNLLEKKSLTYNIDLDDFWKNMKENSKYLNQHSREMLKSRESQLQRLEKCKKKFAVKKCYIPAFSKLQVQSKKYYDI